MFKFLYRGAWTNKTATLTEGDEIRGHYSGRLSCAVEWDWANGRPNPGGHGIQVRIFANDTIGNWIETASFSESYGYYLIIPPFPLWLVATPLGWVVIAVSILGIAIIINKIRKKRHQTSRVEENISLQ